MPELPDIHIPTPVTIPAKTWTNYFQTLLTVIPPGPLDPWPVEWAFNGYDPTTGQVATPDQVPQVVIKRDLKKLVARYQSFSNSMEGTLGCCIGYMPVAAVESAIDAGLSAITDKEKLLADAIAAKVDAVNSATTARTQDIQTAEAAKAAALVIVTGARDTVQHQINDWTSALAQHEAMPDGEAGKAEAIANDQAKIAEYTADLVTANATSTFDTAKCPAIRM